MKKLALTLVMTLTLLGTSAGALAAPLRNGSSCTGNTQTPNFSFKVYSPSASVAGASSLPSWLQSICEEAGVSSNAANGSCTSPEDILNTFGQYFSNGNSQNSNSTIPTATCPVTQEADSAAPATESQTAAAESQSTAAEPAQTPAPTVCVQPAAPVSAQPAATATAQPKAAAAATESSSPATCADNGCTVSNVCGQTSCNSNSALCTPNSCLTNNTCGLAQSTLASCQTMYQYLNSLLEKCGANQMLFPFFQSNSGNSGSGSNTTDETPAPSATPVPTPSATPVPSTTPVPSATPAPSDNGAAEQTTPPAATTTPATNIDNLSFEEQVAALVNQERAAYGLQPLTLSTELSNVARIKSQDMHDKGYFAHTSPTYGSPFDMMNTFGITYRAAGENIAMGYSTPQAVMTAWMNSEGHRANILSSNYTQIGVGYVADGNYWTQEFTG